MFKNWRFNIRTKITIGNLLIVCFLAICLIVVNARIVTLQQEINYIINHDIEVYETANQMEKNEFSMETGQRGFIITGNPAYLQLYSDGNVKLIENYNKLSQLVADNPAQTKNLEQIKATVQEWIDVAGNPTILLKKENKTEELDQFFLVDPGKTYIEQMRSQFTEFLSIEKQLTQSRVKQLEHTNYLLKLSLYLIVALVSIFSIIMAFVISRTIVKTIKQVVKMIAEMSSLNGDFSKRIEIVTNDEISDLGKATNGMIENFEKYVWLQSQIKEVTGLYHGIHDLNQLAQAFITKVTPLMEASFGVIYLRKEEGMELKFVKSAAYALYEEDHVITSFRLGEGLVGQCAQDQRTLELADLPSHYYHIVSGLGQVPPRNLLIIPVIFMNQVEAVLEFASIQAFTPLQRALIEQTQANFGGAIHSVYGRMETEKLLNESQALTEELQSQSEEMQAQSEELQIQQEEMIIINEHLDKQIQLAISKTMELEKTKEELEDFSEQLQRSSQFKSDFLANMSHELRTPLNSILILSQILADNERRALNEEEEKFSRTIHDAGKDLLTLIDDILDLSKVEAGKMDVNISEINVTEIPVHMKLSFDQVAGSKGIMFDVQVDENVPNIFTTDGLRLQQILKNLLSNAFSLRSGALS
jgi:two-component system chemotaxis sensor kinase CheA